MPKLFFEDINVGDTFVGDKVTVDPERMLSFAQEFDSQPMHLDPAAAKAMGLDDVIACGSYTFSLSAKSCTLIWDEVQFLPSGLGFQMSFVAPVYAGDELQLHIEVTNKRPSRN
ncbi:MAG: MaoC/PaaZ C-terminal domain-containing protein, partial [Alphaproteobacteria bacterium]|nr:MaoC/PaaZ C-terminal domain-containing protein [Alphaproteobacteria bacterium]